MSNYYIHDERALLLRVSEGDEKAFALLFHTWSNQLGDFILRITESRPLTQEIVQDVFLKIWINRSQLAQVNSFKAYLTVIAKNHAFNCLKQIAREKKRHTLWEHTVLQAAGTNETEALPENAFRLIDQAVELLPPRQKNIYLLSRREGISQKGIAKRLNISHGTVKKHMVLALRFLRDHIRANTNLFLAVIAFFSGDQKKF